MAQCQVCGARNGTCTHRGYVSPLPPDLLDERSQFVARQTTTETLRMPKQFVREGRGEAGYKTTEGVKLEEYETDEYRNMSAAQSGSTSSTSSSTPSPTKADLLKRAEELGIEGVNQRTSNADLEAAIKAKEGETS